MPRFRRAGQGEGKRSSARVGTRFEMLPFTCFTHIVVVSVAGKPIASYELKLHHDGHPEAGLILPQVRCPQAAVRAAACTRRVGRIVHADELGGKTIVAARRSYSTATRKI